MIKRRTLGQKGDTIVEVLMAVAVVSSVLAIAYSTMNRNLLTMRDNQERTDAAKYAQGQVEALKQLWSTTAGQADIVAARSGPFCIATTGAESTGSGTVSANIATDSFPYSAPCIASYYNLGIRWSGAVTDTYTIYVRWDTIGRDSRGEIVMAYRLP